ncbi:hypothetical protein C1Y42_22400 [Pantoea sp. ICBG 985]|nr:hypothetical protein C1Y42_22400 [Pantoea sp. ICBG 985]
MAVSNTAGSFFRLRPSDLSAPDWPLLKRRRSGKGWFFATISPVTGYAGLTAPAGTCSVLSVLWRLHAAYATFRGSLRTARLPSNSDGIFDLDAYYPLPLSGRIYPPI